MKRIIVLLLCLCCRAAFGDANQDLERAVQSGNKEKAIYAIEAGATNVDKLLSEYMVKSINSSKPNYGMLRVLMRRARRGYSDIQINTLYRNFIIQDCSGNIDYADRQDATDVIRFSVGGFKMSLDTRDALADFITDNDDDQDIVMCVLNYVSRYRMSDEKFLDTLQEFAQIKKAKNVQTLVNALKAEIEKQKSENADKI